MDRSNNGLYLLIIYLLLALYLLPVFPNGGSANELTRWATTVSLVEKNSLEISWTKKLIGGKFVDVTRFDNGQIYSNKSPGISILSAPFYAITRVIIGKPSRDNVHASWFVIRFILGSLPLLLMAFWLYGYEVDAYSLGALLFATPLFPYSLLYYSHVLVAVFIYFAFRLIYDTRRVFPERCFYSGVLAGLAFFCEYTAIVPAIVFGLGLLTTESRERFRRILFYLSGVAPFIFILAIYYQLVFGTPFAIFSQYEIIFPSLTGIYQSLLSPSRGLFFFSPILIFSILTFFTSQDRGFRRHRIKIATILITLLAIVGFSEKYNDWSIGARHIIIIIPLLLDSFFDGEAEEFPSLARGFLFAISFLFCTIPMLTYSFAPVELDFPHASFWRPLLFDSNLFAPTIANTFGLATSIWTILPAMVLLLLAIFFVWRDVRFPLKFTVAVLAGILFAGSYMFLLGPEGKESQMIRERTVKNFRSGVD